MWKIMIDKKMSNNFNILVSDLQKNKASLEIFLNPTSFEDLEANGGIYLCTYKKDPRYVYIGKTIDFVQRWKQHSRDLEKGIHCGEWGEFYKKNNCELSDFEWSILQRISNSKALDAAERKYIHDYEDNGYILMNTIKYKRGKK